MSIFMAKITPSFEFGVYPSSSIHFHSRRDKLSKFSNAFPSSSYKPPTKTSFSPSKLHASTTTIDHQIIDYNAKIREFCDLGNLQNSMELLKLAPSFDLDLKTYCSVLQLCADHKSLEYGKQVHSLIRANGVAVEGVLGAKLVFMYVKCGKLTQGRIIFDVIINDKPFLWNLMINEYANIGDYIESISIFKRMMEIGIEVNSFTFSCVCKSLAAIGSVREGEMVHGCLLKFGFGGHNTVVNSLISFYFKRGCVRSARQLFDELSDRDVISWNSMISGYVANGFSDKGLEMFDEMISSGTKVDFTTLLNVLNGCADCGTCKLSLGRAAHALAIKSRYERENTFNNTLIDMYSKCGDLDGSIRVFEKMGDQRSVVSWTSMLAGYSRQGLFENSVRLFYEMLEAGVRPDNVAITSAIHACACNGFLQHGRKIHDYILENSLQSSVSVPNALMDMYAKCGTMNDAEGVFSNMRVKDIISWNTMIGGYTKNSQPNESLELFAFMLNELKPDERTITCILPACASLSALEKGREIHAHIIRTDCFSDIYVANALVDMYVKCGALVRARLLFDMIPTKDLVSWTVIIAGYGMHGFGTKAVATFNEMIRAGVKPEEISFISILYACSHSGLLDEGWKFFNMMQNEFGIKPKLEHYSCMVDLLARTGNLSNAYTFIKKMPIPPDVTIWGGLLSGCRIHHDVKLAEKVAEHVFELEPENTWYYVLLANIYAEAEKWEEVKKLKFRIGRRWGLKKNTECSWIEISGKVNIFLAGDKSHPQTKKIESLLKRLRLKMKAEGYFPKPSHALINADEVEKEIALCGHSEKLAIAFGILNLSPRKTIRVTKNLGVCGDCHEMAKFISKTAKREIVVRDSNRFHHFKEGVCSCRGFW